MATPQPGDVLAEVARIAERPIDDVRLDSRLTEDLDLDSLGLFELLAWAADKFEIDATRLMSIESWEETTVQDLIELLHMPSTA